MRKGLEFILALAVLAGLVFAGREVSRYASAQKVEANKLVVLDPGHGGRDPGKVGVGDVLEKDLNLAIAKKVKKILEKDGLEVIMTREKDEMLCSEDASNKKVEDLKNRIELINSNEPAVTVSIHQNSYPDETVKGSQIFYFTHSAEGKEAAERMQEEFLAAFPDNTRELKANDTYYLLKKTETITWETELPDKLPAPIQKNQKIGTLHAKLNGKELLSCLVTADDKIDRITYKWYVDKVFKDYFH